MGKFDGVLLVSDCDNTLMDTARIFLTTGGVAEISKENRDALQYFMDNGGKFSVATGRALEAFLPIVPALPFNAPCVVCNGAGVYDFEKKEYIDTMALCPESRERAQEVLDRFPAVGVEAYHVEPGVHAVAINEYIRNHLKLTKLPMIECASMMDVPLPATKIVFEQDYAELSKAEAWIRSQPWASEYEIIYSYSTLLELTAKGASKGGMVARLAKMMDIKPENIYCVGDESNDLSMIQLAAEGFAPANCVPLVRDSGATIVSDCANSALADVVRILDQRY